MSLIHYLESIITVSDDLKDELIAVSESTNIPKNSTIIAIGERCTNLIFVKKGLLRGYYFIEEKEITNWFAQENEFAASFYSFISKKPSFECIQALEDAEVEKIPHQSLQKLFVKFPETERIGRIITENYYVKLEERLLSIQFKSAKERYLNLMELKPTLLKRAALGQIATYLGITQETLSRMRAEL